MMTRRYLSTAIAVALGGCGLEPEQPPPTYGFADNPQQESRDALAGYAVRLGYDRWAMGCGFQVAKAGGSIDDAEKKCLVDFEAAISKADAK